MKAYHCSNTLFEKIELDKRIWNKITHHASGIGLFFDVRKADYLIDFGAILYEITLESNSRTLFLNIYDFKKICDSFSSWEEAQKCGKNLSNHFDIIRIEESNGRLHQGVIINENCVLECKVINGTF